MKSVPVQPDRLPVVEVTYTRDPARRKQLDRLIERTLAGEFTVKPLPAAAD
ncbi:hypothetical protein Q0M94_03590 [Deinococcus radiomollis]|uniref:hypothetical protein n=1 Tax=Deinococcus radiomollis TaxID=468916 RepID=UPI003891D170